MRAIQGWRGVMLITGLTAVLVAFVLISVGPTFFGWHRPHFDREMYQQLYCGMTESEAVAVIGMDGSSYWQPHTIETRTETLMRELEIDSGHCYGLTWFGNDSTIDIFFETGTKKIRGKTFTAGARSTPLRYRFDKWMSSLLSKIGM